MKLDRSKKNSGFTLVELLVVVAIVGILAAIAIPQFAEFRKRGYDSRARSDLRNIVTAEESYFLEHDQYIDVSTNPATGVLSNGGLPAMQFASRGVVMAIVTAGSSYSANSCHQQGLKQFSLTSVNPGDVTGTLLGGGGCT